MQTTFNTTKPEKATLHFFDYVSRKANRQMQSVLTKYSDIDMDATQKKFQKAFNEKSKKINPFISLTERELDALFDTQETMVVRMLDKIVLDDGTVVEEKNKKEFIQNMNDVEFSEATFVAVDIVKAEKEESEKKTKK